MSASSSGPSPSAPIARRPAAGDGRGLPPAWVLALVATVLGLLSAGQMYYFRSIERQPITILQALGAAMPGWYYWAAVAPVVLWVARRFPLDLPRWPRHLPVHLLAAALLSFPHSVILAGASWIILPTRAPDAQLGTWIQGALVNRLQFNLLTYFAILGAGVALDYYRRLRERELRSVQLETQLAQAQLQALKMQLHPHFLFNTLHAIAVLVREDPAAATRTIALLGDLLRHTLATASDQVVPLAQELDFLKLYLEIERTRFADRLAVTFDIAPDALGTHVPSFILQPLVENAVRYGISPRSEPGRIEVRAERRDGVVTLEVWNDGPPLANGGAPPREGIGLTTTRARLEKLYGPRGDFEIGNAAEGGVRVRLTVPTDA